MASIKLMIQLLFASLSLPYLSATQSLGIPPPPGPSNVHITSFPLTDHSRIDPYAPCCHAPRRVMVSLFQPSSCSHTTPVLYMPPKTAAFHDEQFASVGIPNGTFETFRLQTCPLAKPKTSFPFILFSTGMGTSRLVYSAMLQWIASLGFVVVSIDHPYDSDIVEFPDGTVITAANISVPDGLAQDISVRVADASFVLDALSSPSLLRSQNIDTSLIPPFNTNRVGMFGHSLGGATSGDAMLLDKRIISGLNMDGSMFGRAANHTDKKPFTIFAAEKHTQSSDATWASFWTELKGFKLQLTVNETQHGSFTDYPILAKTAGIDGANVPGIDEVIGAIDGNRMMLILRAYIGAFFEFTLKEVNNEPCLLKGPSKDFPEVTFSNSSRH